MIEENSTTVSMTIDSAFATVMEVHFVVVFEPSTNEVAFSGPSSTQNVGDAIAGGLGISGSGSSGSSSGSSGGSSSSSSSATAQSVPGDALRRSIPSLLVVLVPTLVACLLKHPI